MDEADKEPDLFQAQLDMLRSDIRVQQQRQETQQVAMQQLVEQIQQLSKSLSLSTSGSQQRPPGYFNHNGQCWNCKELGHYLRNWPKYKSLEVGNPGSGNASRVSPTGLGGRLNASDVGPKTGTDVSNALSQQSSKQEMTCPGTPMERSHVNEKLRGLYLPGFPAGSRVRQTAFEAHHNLTTVSHRGVRKTLSALQSRYYLPGLTLAVHRLVARCHVCGSKKTWGRKRRAPLKQYVVGAPMERIAIDILGL